VPVAGLRHERDLTSRRVCGWQRRGRTRVPEIQDVPANQEKLGKSASERNNLHHAMVVAAISGTPGSRPRTGSGFEANWKTQAVRCARSGASRRWRPRGHQGKGTKLADRLQQRNGLRRTKPT